MTVGKRVVRLMEWPLMWLEGEIALDETISFKVTMIQAKQLFGYEDDTPL